MSETSVLIVADDLQERSQIGAWLEGSGFNVISCPGPQGPDYTCLGGRGEHCPLADAADVVVLDLRLSSDEMMTGTPGWELLFFYMALGRKVVALSGCEDSIRPGTDEDVTVLQRRPSREALVSAVRDLAKAPPARRRAG